MVFVAKKCEVPSFQDARPRCCDPEAGHFVSNCPIGCSGDMNIYGYVITTRSQYDLVRLTASGVLFFLIIRLISSRVPPLWWALPATLLKVVLVGWDPRPRADQLVREVEGSPLLTRGDQHSLLVPAFGPTPLERDMAAPVCVAGLESNGLIPA